MKVVTIRSGQDFARFEKTECGCKATFQSTRNCGDFAQEDFETTNTVWAEVKAFIQQRMDTAAPKRITFKKK